MLKFIDEEKPVNEESENITAILQRLEKIVIITVIGATVINQLPAIVKLLSETK